MCRRVSSCLLLCLFLSVAAAWLPAQTAQPISGEPVSQFAPLDTIMENVMSQYSAPGAALAVSYNGRLVYARGYGWAETQNNTPVQPDTIMRIASNSKPLTAAAILKLIEEGKLTLDTQPFVTIFTDLTPPAGTTYNTELNQITIGDLLIHEGGWDDTEVPDPDFEYEDIAATAFGDTVPATSQELISYMLSQPLQHTPGTTYAYSNLGYIVLGQVISKVTGGNYTSYESYMQNSIFAPVGLERIQPGQSLLSQQLADEAAYYDYPGAPLVTNVYDPDGGTEGDSCSPASASCVPFPYGGYSVPLNHANGGWVSSAIDLVREFDIMNGQITPGILSSTDPNQNTLHSGSYYPVPMYGQGWYYDFYGSLPGTNSLSRMDTTETVFSGDVMYAAVFNTRNGENIEEPETDADNDIYSALQDVTSWPTNNLFTTYTGSASSCSFALKTTSEAFTDAGGTGTVAVTDANYCAWLATSNASWITVTSGALNSAAGSVGYTVAANTGATRTGTITIAGLTFTVTQTGVDATTTTLTASPNPAHVGQAVMLTATVKRSSVSGTPTGSVKFYVGSTELTSVTLNSSGVATLTASSNGYAPGAYPIVAKYSGDSNDGTSDSAATTVTLEKADTTVTLTASPNPVTPPADCTLTAKVARAAGSGVPTGTVTFTVDGSKLASVQLNGSGVATLKAPTSGIAAGNYPVTATYGGDTSDNTAASTPLTVVVK